MPYLNGESECHSCIGRRDLSRENNDEKGNDEGDAHNLRRNYI